MIDVFGYSLLKKQSRGGNDPVQHFLGVFFKRQSVCLGMNTPDTCLQFVGDVPMDNGIGSEFDSSSGGGRNSSSYNLIVSSL